MKISIIVAHADDESLMAGATVHSFLDSFELNDDEYDHDIRVLCFSDRHTQPDPSSKEELESACSRIGIDLKNVKLLNYMAIEFPRYFKEIRKSLEEYRKEFDPDFVITNSPDLHQDHRVLSQEVCSVFRDRSVLFGEGGNSEYNFQPNFFVPVEPKDLYAKEEALFYYKAEQGKQYMSHEQIFGLAKMRGTMIRQEYAEAFQVFRCIW